MNQSQSSENLYEVDQQAVPQRQQVNGGYVQPNYSHTGQAVPNVQQIPYVQQPGYVGPQPQVVYIESQKKDNMIGAVVVSGILSFLFTPVIGLIALCCFTSVRERGGVLIGTAVGTLINGIIILAAAGPVRASCDSVCQQLNDNTFTSSGSGSMTTAPANTYSCNCASTQRYMHVIGGIFIGAAALLAIAGYITARKASRGNNRTST